MVKDKALHRTLFPAIPVAAEKGQMNLPITFSHRNAAPMQEILAQSETDFQHWLTSKKEPKYRHRQILQWLYQGRANSFAEMSDLPNRLRTALQDEFTIWTSQVVREQVASDGTTKLLLQLHDGGRIECVLLRDGIRRTVCVSTQVGCAMGCVFCASGLNGVDRNLTRGEILEQVLLLQRRLPDDERLSHVVVMGMGEPLANLDELLPALDFVSSKQGVGISTRKITISTVGLPKAMDRLSSLGRHYQLAVSLHAPNDRLRNELVPVNKNIGINAIMDSAIQYFEKSGRRLTFEYVLMEGVNDSTQHARELASRLKNVNALLNVIPYNPVSGLPYVTPTVESVQRFRSISESQGINLQVRQRKGDKINAACGQLRRSTSDLVQVNSTASDGIP